MTSGDVRILFWASFASTGLVSHGFTTRHGGVSDGVYASLNMAFHVGDHPARVLVNRSRACAALGMDPAHLVAGQQVHGDRVAVVDRSHRGRGAVAGEDSLPATDALVTGERLLPLSSYYADCVPIFLLDPVCRVVALAHAGWKGTCLSIGWKTVQTMSRVYGCRPRDCLAIIGPSIGPCCYEVDAPLVDSFQKNLPFWQQVFIPRGGGKWRLDLWEANRLILLNAGLLPGNITLAGICTSCRQDLFFSYRGSKGCTGRMASLIMLT
ncbi:peptidoglycan editing factor PgeF [Desulfofundulus thermobenzoicus]|uniref:Purine nucleoside phosphorylase n=1 Tax=Desulfofundulus thermobenzoicus TaxID=29376 RepID=A0A6N7ISS0_9FIRM|nr:peptidoglycan editing factor PgeF [Desulfofundulus thermobenzoicus]HHW44841.1 peptidoglycan editing factor PgeF [Desulfotomaculum sp.]